jgi:uncharacterized membrane protein YhaH (DUF805 family)
MKLVSFLFSPKGTVPRIDYFVGNVILFIITTFIFVLPSLIDFSSSVSTEATNLGYVFSLTDLIAYLSPSETLSTNSKILMGSLYILGALNFVYSHFCLVLKRLRDMGQSTWWSALIFVPFVNITALAFLFYPSKKESYA